MTVNLMYIQKDEADDDDSCVWKNENSPWLMSEACITNLHFEIYPLDYDFHQILY